mmetsp:Transcript_17188/g.26563  ORF Transcript_17188/g.26563 Transcript_17188/m.26563 type:complete len:142 (+) Transcript_17188:128-553(+)|eukprot:CAMPEP_0170505534 /NCGR_PEP_ID=MMETSP0208-20121228/51264_1 /TAXON_ID=197538 /ORGANISM="Strombidium inclinatum, Strain S3" /LENGTH=141 /DNA_ID=CAMNT_0010786465 /DNA_START=122 /DNA_END=547 /DNA_ORIENTATION=+
MPDFSNFLRDYQVLLFCMLLGFLSFQQTHAQLSKYLGTVLNTDISVKGALNETKEKLESYFLHHNSLDGVPKFTVKDMENWLQQIEINFVMNYKTIRESSFFNELTPNIQSKLLNSLMEKELKFFPFLFFDIGSNLEHEGM